MSDDFETLDEAEKRANTKITATPYVWRDPASIPRRAWLYGKHYVRGFVTCTIAPGSLGKSSLLLVEAIAIASARALLGIMPTEKCKVWYWNGEDPQVETERRIAAICQHYQLDGRELEATLFVELGRLNPIKLAQVVRGEILFDDALAADICRTIQENKIDVVVFDPFISVHGVPESDNTNVDAVVKKLGHIADATNVALEFAHHVRKQATGQTEITADDARGASSIINAVRSGRVMNRMTKEQAATLTIAEPRLYFRVDDAKTNLAPPEAARWHSLVSEELSNGDHVAVVKPWTMPSTFDGVFVHHMHAVREMAAAGDWRKDARADSWIGHAVAKVTEININDKAGRKRIGAMLEAWFTNGVLTTELRKDGQRKDKEFVVPGNWNGEALS